MLPAVRTNLTAAVTAAALAAALALAAAAPAMAWGKREQGFVAGAATAILLYEIARDNKRRNGARRAAPAPQPVYVPAPHYTAAPAKAAFLEYSANGRRAIQARLRAYGYYTGAIDGVWGPGTARAVEAYARDSGYAGGLSSRDGAIQFYNALIG